MTDTTILQSTQPKREKVNPRDIIGGTFENIFDTIIGSGAGYVNEGPVGVEQLSQATKWHETRPKGLETGSLTGFQIPRTPEKTDQQLLAEQRSAVAEAESILRQSRIEFVTQEEIRHGVAGMSEEDRNRRLRLNASLRRAHTEDPYHMTELYRQAKEEALATAQQKADTEIPSSTKQPNSLEVAFEGASGSKGNLSFQAVG
ncbi:MAG: hypothetical protein PHV63_01990 [Candidatus Daviesbacteria bacterium]|nr:hypothetical protein [Candidatus Daviesbacteria bacterium]